jgi:hypothetical protein
MRPNKFGIRGLKCVWLKGRFVYFWVPPVSLQIAGIFRHTTLGTDFDTAVSKARVWNERLWHRRNFTGTARRIARLTGLPDELQIRDLRRTGATEAASAGGTPAELMAVGGWTNQASIRPYLVQTLEQAASVQAKRDAYRRYHANNARVRK